MKNNLKNTDFALDMNGCPVLTQYQTDVLLYFFEHGPDYVYSIEANTEIRQQTLDAVTKRLDAGGLIYVKEEINVAGKGMPRKIYALTGPGWCAAAMLLLKQGNLPFVNESVVETLNRGIARRADAFKRADDRDDSLHGQLLDTLTEEPLRGGERGYALFLEHWEEIIRTAEVYPNPPDFGTCMNWVQSGFFAKTPDLFLPRNNPCWLWHAALYYACSGAFGVYSQTGENRINGAVFDVFFSTYLVTGGA
jgi:DNA-binding PadR family transcriptional regulator